VHELPMSDHRAFYELEGIRTDGSVFTGEILGRQTLAEAVALARYYTGLWAQRVRLYRVPYLNTTSVPWAEDERELVNDFIAEEQGRKNPESYTERSYYERWLDGSEERPAVKHR
jgi:hypothetical protein